MDRRQPHVRWTAVFAGALAAGGLWLLLQLLFTGGALASIDPDEVDHVRAFGIGASVGSMLAPLLAMFAGGLLAGYLASHRDKKVLGLHGALVWALTTVLGFVITATAISQIASNPQVDAHAQMASNAPAPGANDFIESSVKNVNASLKAQNAPSITKDDIIDASQYAVTSQGTIDRAAFVNRLDAKTQLSQPEAELAVTALGDRTPDVIAQANRVAQHREHALEMAEDTGEAMLAAGLALLLCLGAAVGGSLLAQRLRRRNAYDLTHAQTTQTSQTVMHHTATAPYPVASPTEPMATPAAGNYGLRNPID